MIDKNKIKSIKQIIESNRKVAIGPSDYMVKALEDIFREIYIENDIVSKESSEILSMLKELYIDDNILYFADFIDKSDIMLEIANKKKSNNPIFKFELDNEYFKFAKKMYVFNKLLAVRREIIKVYLARNTVIEDLAETFTLDKSKKLFMAFNVLSAVDDKLDAGWPRFIATIKRKNYQLLENNDQIIEKGLLFNSSINPQKIAKLLNIDNINNTIIKEDNKEYLFYTLRRKLFTSRQDFKKDILTCFNKRLDEVAEHKNPVLVKDLVETSLKNMRESEIEWTIKKCGYKLNDLNIDNTFIVNLLLSGHYNKFLEVTNKLKKINDLPIQDLYTIFTVSRQQSKDFYSNKGEDGFNKLKKLFENKGYATINDVNKELYIKIVRRKIVSGIDQNTIINDNITFNRLDEEKELFVILKNTTIRSINVLLAIKNMKDFGYILTKSEFKQIITGIKRGYNKSDMAQLNNVLIDNLPKQIPESLSFKEKSIQFRNTCTDIIKDLIKDQHLSQAETEDYINLLAGNYNELRFYVDTTNNEKENKEKLIGLLSSYFINPLTEQGIWIERTNIVEDIPKTVEKEIYENNQKLLCQSIDVSNDKRTKIKI